MKLTGKSPHPVNQPRCWAVWVTAGADGTEHAVTDEQMSVGRAERTGVYVAQCGLRFAAAAMVAPALRRCSDCLLLTPTPTRRSVGLPRGGLLTRATDRLHRLLRTPAAVSPYSEGTASRRKGSHGGAGEHAPRCPGVTVTRHNRVAATS